MNSEVRKNIETMNETNARVFTPHLKEVMDNPTLSLLKDVRLEMLHKEKPIIDQEHINEY